MISKNSNSAINLFLTYPLACSTVTRTTTQPIQISVQQSLTCVSYTSPDHKAQLRWTHWSTSRFSKRATPFVSPSPVTPHKTQDRVSWTSVGGCADVNQSSWRFVIFKDGSRRSV